jgi:hypothetical protein
VGVGPAGRRPAGPATGPPCDRPTAGPPSLAQPPLGASPRTARRPHIHAATATLARTRGDAPPARRTSRPDAHPEPRTSRPDAHPEPRTSRPDAHPCPTHIPSHARIHPCRRCPPAGVPRRLDRRDPARSTLGTPDRVHRSPPGTAHRPSLRILSFHDPYLGTRCRAVPVRATAACPESEILVDEDLGFGTLCSVNRPVLGRSARPGTRVCRRDQRAR